MSLIQLTDGTQHFILSPNDLVDIAYSTLGDEYSTEIEKVIHTSSENEIYAEKRYNSDMDSYEGQIEEYRDCMLEVMEIAEEIETYMHESKHFEKKKALEKIELIIRKLNSEL